MTTQQTFVVVGLGLAVLAMYAGSCYWFPFGKCACCGGAGKHVRKDGKVFRSCTSRWRCWPSDCGGTGRRLRVGRRVWNAVTRLREDAA